MMAYVWQLEPTETQNNDLFFSHVYSFLEMLRRAPPEQIEPHFKSYCPEKEVIELDFGETLIFRRVPVDGLEPSGIPIIDPAKNITVTRERAVLRIFSY